MAVISFVRRVQGMNLRDDLCQLIHDHGTQSVTALELSFPR
ncbi:hypothetical protein [Crossiella sp. NPDC003009]